MKALFNVKAESKPARNVGRRYSCSEDAGLAMCTGSGYGFRDSGDNLTKTSIFVSEKETSSWKP